MALVAEALEANRFTHFALAPHPCSLSKIDSHDDEDIHNPLNLDLTRIPHPNSASHNPPVADYSSLLFVITE